MTRLIRHHGCSALTVAEQIEHHCVECGKDTDKQVKP